LCPAEWCTGDRGPGSTSEESAELERLRRKNAELKHANEILKSVASFFAEFNRPHTR
jgi:transposase